ncbi:hypothetical protein M3Y95_00556500 [Aphelenchoides besseyi]|nr:hypothetical protein M3Y95_00556500 [Aphelenchoides besseyi]
MSTRKCSSKHTHDEGFRSMVILLTLSVLIVILLLTIVSYNLYNCIIEKNLCKKEKKFRRDFRADEEFMERYRWNVKYQKEKKQLERKFGLEYWKGLQANFTDPVDDDLPLFNEMPDFIPTL